MSINQNDHVQSLWNAESSVDILWNYYEGLKVPAQTQFLLDRFAQHIRSHRLSIPNKIPTTDISFENEHDKNISFNDLRKLFYVLLVPIITNKKCEVKLLTSHLTS